MNLPPDSMIEEYREAAHYWQAKWAEAQAKLDSISNTVVTRARIAMPLGTWVMGFQITSINNGIDRLFFRAQDAQDWLEHYMPGMPVQWNLQPTE